MTSAEDSSQSSKKLSWPSLHSTTLRSPSKLAATVLAATAPVLFPHEKKTFPVLGLRIIRIEDPFSALKAESDLDTPKVKFAIAHV